MRLAGLFLGVLAASALLASLAAWGITYGTAYSRVIAMSSEFSTLSNSVLGEFETFVADLLWDDAQLLTGFLALERDSGEARTRETQAAMERTIGALVNYTANATDQSQAQMNAVVDTFAALMGSVVADFKGVATSYAGQLRAEVATKTSAVIVQAILSRMTSLQRFQTLYALGVLNLSVAAWEPIGEADCTLLGFLCAAAAEMGNVEPLTLALATGRSYACTIGREASVSRIIANGSQYTEELVMWVPTFSSFFMITHQCLTQAPAAAVVAVGPGCPLPQGCGCGRDQRCTPWYAAHAGDVGPSFAKDDPFPGASGAPTTSISFSIFSLSATAPSLLAVVSDNFELAGIDIYLAMMITTPSTVFAVLNNDSSLTAIGSTGAKCAANATAPGDPALPTSSALRACEPGLRTVAQWLFQHRATTASATSLQFDGVVWDVFATDLRYTSYFFIIGTPLSVINAAVDASEARAASQLADVRTQQLSLVAASGVATKAYMAAVGQENLQVSQAMERSSRAQLQGLENTSRAALVRSQLRSAEQVQQMTKSQRSDIEALTARHLSAIAVTTGWTLGVVFGILLGVLLCSAWGTVRVTSDLNSIIDLMEDVADMKVEDLSVPQGSRVTEVARIEAAFQVLVQRLAQYKSYIPAGVFEQMHRDEAAAGQQPASESDMETMSVGGGSSMVHRSPQTPCDKARSLPSPAARGPVPLIRVQRFPSCSSSGSVCSARNPAAHRIAALSVHAPDLTGLVAQLAPLQAKALLSQYITHIHEAVSQHRGNVDFVAGDQVAVTFNAHIPCGDPAAAAVAAAFEMCRLLQQPAQERLKFQVGIAFGPALAGSVGYKKFRSMVSLGLPLKVAVMISQMSGFESGAILIDSSVEERMKYAYELRPVELVHFPQARPLAPTLLLRHRRVFLAQAKRQVDEDEWLYQVERLAPATEWTEVFNCVVAATSAAEGHAHLERFLEVHPRDAVALRLQGRLAAWTPGLGLPLWDRAEHEDRRPMAPLS